MKWFSALLGVWIAGVVAVSGQSVPLSPVFVVRLDAPAGVAGAGQQGATVVAGATEKERGRELRPMPVTRLEDSTAAAILDAPRTLSLRFSAPQSIRQVLLLLVRDTGLSLVASGDVDGTFTGELAGVTLRQALDLVLGAQDLAYRAEGNAIRVFRREMETRILDVNAIAARRDPVASASGDTFDDLEKSAKTLLSPAGRLGVDRKAGLVHVTDYPERVASVSAYLESLERRLNRQVDILARVVEVTHDSPDASSVNWSEALGQARSSGGSVAALDLDRLLAALARHGSAHVLTSSEVKALHNEQAVVRIGLDGPPFEGLALAVTPQIAADGTILLAVAPRLTRSVADPSAAASAAPVVSISDVSTAVRVRDGETLVLPGFRQARSEIAVLLTMKVM